MALGSRRRQQAHHLRRPHRRRHHQIRRRRTGRQAGDLGLAQGGAEQREIIDPSPQRVAGGSELLAQENFRHVCGQHRRSAGLRHQQLAIDPDFFGRAILDKREMVPLLPVEAWEHTVHRSGKPSGGAFTTTGRIEINRAISVGQVDLETAVAAGSTCRSEPNR